ncbi:Uncharacterized protein GBIM_12894, partial [Gryllus bimaculatus]
PKTRHQRPFGWETGAGCAPAAAPPPPPRELRFGSLPTPTPAHDALPLAARLPPPWLPPRTVPGVLERHRGVRRHPSQEDGSPELLPPPPPRVDYEGERARDDADDEEDERANFSEDSLEELPMPATKRSSIAWEVPLDDDPLLTPGSTKVVGRRRRRSGDHSSTGSIHRLRDADDWPDPPVSTEDEAPSPFSDSYYDSSATNDLDDFVPPKLPPQHAPNGTYIIRKGRKKERKPVPDMLSPQEIVPPKFGDLKRCSSTFDNIKSLIKEGLLEGLDDAPPDFKPPTPPGLVRVVSLPTLPSNDNSFSHHDNSHYRSKADSHRLQRPHELAVTMEEEEDLQFCSNLDNLSDEAGLSAELSSNDEENKLIEQLEREHFQNLQNKANEIRPRENGSLSRNESPLSNRNSFEKAASLESRDIGHKRNKQRSHQRDKLVNGSLTKDHERNNHSFHHKRATEVETSDPWTTVAELNHVQPVPVVEDEANGTQSSALPADNFKVTVEVLQHEFPPLPPSPVEEDEEEYSEIVHPSPAQTPQSKSDTLPEPFYRSPEPGSDPIGTRFLSRPCPPEPPPHQEPMSSLKTRSMDAGFSRGHRSHSSNNRREIPSERRTLPPEIPGPPRRRTFQKRSAHSPREEGMQTSCSLPETPIFARGCDIPRTPHRRAPDVPSGAARTTPRPSGLVTTGYRRPGAGHGTTAGLGSGGLGQALVGAELLRLAGGPGRGWYPRHRQQPRPASVERLDRLAPGHSPGHSLPSPWDTRDSRKPLTLPPNLSPKFFHRSPREALRRGSGEGGGRQKRGFFKSFWKRSRHYSLEQPPPAPPQ